MSNSPQPSFWQRNGGSVNAGKDRQKLALAQPFADNTHTLNRVDKGRVKIVDGLCETFGGLFVSFVVEEEDFNVP